MISIVLMIIITVMIMILNKIVCVIPCKSSSYHSIFRLSYCLSSVDTLFNIFHPV